MFVGTSSPQMFMGTGSPQMFVGTGSLSPPPSIQLFVTLHLFLQLSQTFYGHMFFVTPTKHPTPSHIASLSSFNLDAIKVMFVFDLCLQVYTIDIPSLYDRCPCL
jgi:hypothetical protein